jgi:hypothetical protein
VTVRAHELALGQFQQDALAGPPVVDGPADIDQLVRTGVIPVHRGWMKYLAAVRARLPAFHLPQPNRKASLAVHPNRKIVLGVSRPAVMIVLASAWLADRLVAIPLCDIAVEFGQPLGEPATAADFCF